MQTIAQAYGLVTKAARELRAAGLQVNDHNVSYWLALPADRRRDWLSPCQEGVWQQ
jgi:hypothetical protein